MNSTTLLVPKAKKRQSVGAQIFLIIILSVMAGSHLEKALLRCVAPRQPYEWIEDLTLGIAFLVGTIALALRLRREATLGPPDELISVVPLTLRIDD